MDFLIFSSYIFLKMQAAGLDSFRNNRWWYDGNETEDGSFKDEGKWIRRSVGMVISEFGETGCNVDKRKRDVAFCANFWLSFVTCVERSCSVFSFGSDIKDFPSLVLGDNGSSTCSISTMDMNE